MRNLKIWHLTIVAIVCALLGGAAVALHQKHAQHEEAVALPDAARIERVDGEVALTNTLAPALARDETRAPAGGAESTTQWGAAAANQPFSVGDRIYTREGSHASLAFTGRNYARLEPNTGLDVLTLADRRTQLALRDGSAMFDLGYLAPGEAFEVATPYGAVNFSQPGLYHVGLRNGGAIVSVLSGLAQIAGLGGDGRITKGEMATILGTTAAQVLLSRLNGDRAGVLVDDYYRAQYPGYYDGRYRSYDAYLSDPFYFDPYRRDPSYQHVAAIIPGVNDLDEYGDWQNLDDYGAVWRPSVASGWAPYQQGQWINLYPYGPTWVSSEPWGYAPYHYGRWVNQDDQWYWVPDATNTTPQFSPALVAFVPLQSSNEIGWVPLAPGDPYVPRTYDDRWQPIYLSSTAVSPARVVNLSVPGALTVVSAADFSRPIDRRIIVTPTPQLLAQARPTLDPLTLTPLRNAVVHSAWGRGKISLPPGIAKKLYETQVVTNAAPSAPHSKKDLARVWRAEKVDDHFKRQKPEVRDERRAEQAQQAVQVDKHGRQESHEVGKRQRSRAEPLRVQPERVSAPAPKHEKHQRGEAPPRAQHERGGGGKHGQPSQPQAAPAPANPSANPGKHGGHGGGGEAKGNAGGDKHGGGGGKGGGDKHGGGKGGGKGKGQ